MSTRKHSFMITIEFVKKNMIAIQLLMPRSSSSSQRRYSSINLTEKSRCVDFSNITIIYQHHFRLLYAEKPEALAPRDFHVMSAADLAGGVDIEKEERFGR
ncbi:hypothetical protein CEXT_366841 [Caerostris extrusa]|uniref:Uncharacterized protein n=1 Tax=Caerostris extrusa TaxID=172846 RepID=A0AAV4W7E0_CAEEX|nr:hypothetical protein CEXT_366841 [Caerostris extrusa]